MEEKVHIVSQDYKVQRSDREAQNGHRSALILFTGFSGSGKSTLANMVEQELFNRHIHSYVIDGDNLRKGLNRNLGFSHEDRVENTRRISEVAKILCGAGIVVLAALVSPFKRDREMLKGCIRDTFFEIFVDTPLEVCEKRDVKGLYAMARKGEIKDFTGISSPFEVPARPDVHINTQRLSAEESVRMILEHILPKLKL